VANNVNKLKQD